MIKGDLTFELSTHISRGDNSLLLHGADPKSFKLLLFIYRPWKSESYLLSDAGQTNTDLGLVWKVEKRFHYSIALHVWYITDYELFRKKWFDVPALSWVIPVQESREFGIYPAFLCIKR